jgi:tRNA1Val (adenine37-N6)-methyltransferase
MAQTYFKFKQFTILQEKAAFKVGTDGVLLGAWTRTSGTGKILDVGTGTGLIALMIAQKSDAQITALEPDKDSFDQAVENIINSPWADRIKVEMVNFQDFCKSNNEPFDLIISNPPYFNNSLKNPDTRKTSCRHTETLSSVDILKGASGLLSENGKLCLILPYAEGNLFIAEAVSFGFYCNNILKVKSHPGSPVRRLLLEFGKTKEPLTEKFLTIETGGRHVYSAAYIDLTKDFYLNM